MTPVFDIHTRRKSRPWLVGLTATLLAFALPTSLLAQAKIDERQVKQTLYVAPTGNDNNSGRETSKPLATLQKAVDSAGTTPTRIVLGDGVYRDYTTINKGDSLLIIEAAKPGKAIITGADVFSNWEPTETPNVIAHDWPHKWGVGTELGWWGSTAFNRRREMVYFDDTRLTQRIGDMGDAVSPSALKPGEFTVDENLGKVFMRPPAGSDWKKVAIEMPVRGYDPDSYGWVGVASRPLLRVYDRSNLVLRGLVVKRAANYMKFGAAVQLSGSEHVGTPGELPENVLVDQLTVIENNAIGMEISNYRNVTVQNSKFNDNGQRGAGMVQVGVERPQNGTRGPVAPRNYLWQDCQFNDNNWRMVGTWGDMNDSAGFKAFGQASDSVLFLRCQFNRNLANGFWQDYAGSNLTLDSCLVEGNSGTGAGGYGILSEMTRGPFTVRNSVIRNNTNAGVISSGSPDVVLENNFIYHNNYTPGNTNNYFCHEIRMNSDIGRDSADFDHSLEGWKITGNTIASLGGTTNNVQVIGFVLQMNGKPFPSGRTPAAEFAYNVVSDRNTWSKNPSDKAGPPILFSLGATQSNPDITLEEWQQQTNRHGKQDKNSRFVFPLDLKNVKDPTVRK